MILYFPNTTSVHEIESYLHELYGPYREQWHYRGSIFHGLDDSTVLRYGVNRENAPDGEIFLLRMKLNLQAVETDIVLKPFLWVTDSYAKHLLPEWLPVT